ncbi:MAG: hypothetical protein RSE14_13850 [Erythrobacter sp.]|jgi:hypothetical protein|uniref:hypothetical protein n=1 Tax=Erythrobacter sp. TaxID=1042 RepID=UPI002B46DC6B|nr:hypothetical protein [Erythrobacter sp.]WRH70327.1 MAG: hypothetical protein RSE14_13850 [Erythrobacter sp.]
MHKQARRLAMAAVAAMVAAGATPLPLTRPAAAQDSAATAERDLYLECTAVSGDYASMTLAINAERRLAYGRPHNHPRGRTSFGVRYETDAIWLYRNRLSNGWPKVNSSIDRKSLVLTHWLTANAESQEREVIGTAQCREIEPVPGLMPFERRSDQGGAGGASPRP